MRHKVVFFRGVEMTPAQHVAFGRLFGELTVHPFMSHLDEYPEVIVLDNHQDNPVFATDVWHSDETFRLIPPMGSILRCIRRPPTGGDTLWADMAAAYEGLSDKMQHFLSGLEAIHDFKMFRKKFDELPPREKHTKLAQMEEELPNPAHPVVRTHPVTGRRCSSSTSSSRSRSRACARTRAARFSPSSASSRTSPNTSSAFRWEPNDMVFWDNRPTQHYAANDYYPQRRTMQRLTIKGEKPV